MIRKFFLSVAGRVGVFLIDALLFSCRTEWTGDAEIRQILGSGRFIMASWHGRLILFFNGPRAFHTAVMTSRSKDGALAAWLQTSGGYRVFRGSSRKGGRTALEQMAAYMVAENQPAMLSVDGPTGPRYVCKPGVADLAAATGFPIVPITFSASRAVVFRSWDRCMLPKPFSKLSVACGKPVHVPKNASEPVRARAVREVESELSRLTQGLDAGFDLDIR